MLENDYEIFDRGKDGDRTLSVKKKWSKRIGKVVVSEQITSLTLSSLGGWKDSDLCFLKGLEQLRRVYIHSERTLDLSPLLALPNLRDLSLRAKCSKAVDLAGLKKLRSLSFAVVRLVSGAQQCIWIETD